MLLKQNFYAHNKKENNAILITAPVAHFDGNGPTYTSFIVLNSDVEQLCLMPITSVV